MPAMERCSSSGALIWLLVGRIDLGEDADNVRIDPNTHHVLVGYGKGALAVIDPVSRKKIGDVKLQGHPESFQLTADGSEGFINCSRRALSVQP